MKKQTFVPEHTVPAQTVDENIIALTFYPGNKNVTVLTDTTDASVNNTVNIQPVLDLMTDNQKIIVRTFLKKVAALRLAVDDSEVIGDAL